MIPHSYGRYGSTPGARTRGLRRRSVGYGDDQLRSHRVARSRWPTLLVRLARALQPGERLSEFSNRRSLRLTSRLTLERLRLQSDRRIQRGFGVPGHRWLGPCRHDLPGVRFGRAPSTARAIGVGVWPLTGLLCSCFGLRTSRPPLFLPAIAIASPKSVALPADTARATPPPDYACTHRASRIELPALRRVRSRSGELTPPAGPSDPE